MKKLIDSTEIVQDYVLSILKKQNYSMVFWFPGESLLFKEVSDAFGLHSDSGDMDNKIAIIHFSTLSEVKEKWEQILKKHSSIVPEIEVYKKNKRITF